MKKHMLIILLVCFLLQGCSDTGEGPVKPEEKDDGQAVSGLLTGELFMDVSELEKAGFETFRSYYFTMLMEGERIYIINFRDCMAARFNGERKFERQYKSCGEDPGSFLFVNGIYRHDPDTLVVFDAKKNKRLIFDNDLNFIAEKRFPREVRALFRCDGLHYAVGDFNDYFLALLDNEYKVTVSFGKKNMTIADEPVFIRLAYQGYVIPGKELAATSWVYLRQKECKADIYNAETQKIKVTLKWTHPQPPTDRDIKQRRNIYACLNINKHGDYYVVQNYFRKNNDSSEVGHINYLYLFDQNGKMVFYSDKLPNKVVPAFEVGVNKSYTLDENGNIRFLELDKLAALPLKTR